MIIQSDYNVAVLQWIKSCTHRSGAPVNAHIKHQNRKKCELGDYGVIGGARQAGLNTADLLGFSQQSLELNESVWSQQRDYGNPDNHSVRPW